MSRAHGIPNNFIGLNVAVAEDGPTPGLGQHALTGVPLLTTVLMTWTSKAGCKPALRVGGSAEMLGGVNVLGGNVTNLAAAAAHGLPFIPAAVL